MERNQFTFEMINDESEHSNVSNGESNNIYEYTLKSFQLNESDRQSCNTNSKRDMHS